MMLNTNVIEPIIMVNRIKKRLSLCAMAIAYKASRFKSLYIVLH